MRQQQLPSPGTGLDDRIENLKLPSLADAEALRSELTLLRKEMEAHCMKMKTEEGERKKRMENTLVQKKVAAHLSVMLSTLVTLRQRSRPASTSVVNSGSRFCLYIWVWLTCSRQQNRQHLGTSG